MTHKTILGVTIRSEGTLKYCLEAIKFDASLVEQKEITRKDSEYYLRSWIANSFLGTIATTITTSPLDLSFIPTDVTRMAKSPCVQLHFLPRIPLTISRVNTISHRISRFHFHLPGTIHSERREVTLIASSHDHAWCKSWCSRSTKEFHGSSIPLEVTDATHSLLSARFLQNPEEKAR